MFWNKKIGYLGTALLPSILVLSVGSRIGKADFTFGEPTRMGPPINSAGDEMAPYISADGLEFYIQREDPDLLGEIYVAHRPTVDDEWGEPVKLGPTVNTPEYEGGPSLSGDQLSLYFGGSANGELLVARRPTVNDDWGTAANLGPTVNSDFAFGASVSPDELELYFHSDRPGGYGDLDVWVTTRASVNDDWGTPVNLGPMVNTLASDNWPGISPDGLVLFFASTKPGGSGGWDLYMTRRATKNDPWGPSVNLGPTINGTASEVHAKVSYDGSMLYYCPFGLGETADIWQVPILPTVDFNADGAVDLADLVMLIDNWGTDDPLYDIGPFAWGDGKVDIEDLKAFIAEWEKENPPAQP